MQTQLDVVDWLLDFAYFGEDVRGIVDRLLGEQMSDGGWNCEQENGSTRGSSTGEVIDPVWTKFSYPTYWHYDVLRGLDYLRAAGAEPDGRLAEAITLVESKRDTNGRWPLENPYPGRLHFPMDEGEGRPSRWNTLRAMRVLRWYGDGERAVG